MKIAVLSNINADSIVRRLSSQYSVYQPSGFDTWISEIFNIEADLYKQKPSDCFLILDAHGHFNCQVAKDAIIFLSKNMPESRIYISTLNVVWNDIVPLKSEYAIYHDAYQWYTIATSLVSHISNIFLFDINAIVLKFGTEKIYSDKIWYLASNPFSAFGEKCVVSNIEKILEKTNTARKKCLVLDLDNTLWGGVIGEEGLEGIQLSTNKEGARYYDFQKQILRLKKLGILLAIVSKNNIEDAQQAFSHPNMILQWDDFIIKKINWSPKSTNIADIAHELNIGLDSLVFVDDNPIERAEVATALPEVNIANFPKDTCQLANFAYDLYEQYFFTFKISDEDTRKHQLYVDNIARIENKQHYASLNNYLQDLQMHLYIREAREEDIPRIFQLIQKTNQFNLTTKRYDETALQSMMRSNKWLILIGSVEDKFGDNGQCIVIICSLDQQIAHIDSFLMSCRVMGRFIENSALKYLENILWEKNIRTVIANFQPTKKNVPAADFYERSGYELNQIDTDGTKEYRFDLTRKEERNLICFAIIN